MSYKKPLSATSLLEWSDQLPKLPSVLPDGTKLDFDATDDYWQDIPGHHEPSENADSKIDKDQQPVQMPSEPSKAPELPVLKPKDGSVSNTDAKTEKPVAKTEKPKSADASDKEEGDEEEGDEADKEESVPGDKEDSIKGESMNFGDRIKLTEDFDLEESRKTKGMTPHDAGAWHGYWGRRGQLKADFHDAQATRKLRNNDITGAEKHQKMAKAYKALADKHLDKSNEFRKKLDDKGKSNFHDYVNSDMFQRGIKKDQSAWERSQENKISKREAEAKKKMAAMPKPPVGNVGPKVRPGAEKAKAISAAKFYGGKSESKEAAMEQHIVLNEDTGDYDVSESMYELLNKIVAVMESCGYEIQEGIDLVTLIEGVEEALETDNELPEDRKDWLGRALQTISEAVDADCEDCEEGDEGCGCDKKKPEEADVDDSAYGEEEKYKPGMPADKSSAEKPYKKS